jgi:lipoprotein-anchoring transpeptidase ErfK/SrfK
MLKARIEDQIRSLAALTSVVLIATAEALAQENQASPARRVVVSIPDRKLAVMDAGRVVKIFSTAVGAPESPSPSGVFQIVNSIPDPTWYSKGKIVPPGPSNPLGPHWLGLSLKGYGIHGTSNPNSIGHDASHGCIRLRNADIRELAKMVRIGDAVELHAERTPETEQIFGQVVVADRTTATAGVGASQ